MQTTGEERPFRLPDDPKQIGDLTVYLCRVTAKGKERFAFHRFSAEEVTSASMEPRVLPVAMSPRGAAR